MSRMYAGLLALVLGGSLAFAAYGALAAGARGILERGTSRYTQGMLTAEERMYAFGPGQD